MKPKLRTEREDELSTRVALLEATATAVPDTPTPRPTLSDEVEATSDTIALTRESAASPPAMLEAGEEAEDPTNQLQIQWPSPTHLITPPLKADFGPVEGELTHEEDNVIELTLCTDNTPQDFVVSAIIGNPFSAEKGSWDFGLIFRQG